MRVAVMGGTRGMGREVARLLAERGDSLVLLGRNDEAMAEAAQDLTVRGARAVHSVRCDLGDTERHDDALAEAAEHLGRLDAVVVTAALFGTQEQLEEDPTLLARVLDLGFTKTILFCETARKRLLSQGGGQLVVFSSVAGDRGRKTVGLYGATKSGLSHYLEALDHKYRAEGLVTMCVKPGFVRTDMTAGLKEPPFAADPDEVAKVVVSGMDRQVPLVYAPGIWRLVMLVIKHLPRFVMRRVGF